MDHKEFEESPDSQWETCASVLRDDPSPPRVRLAGVPFPLDPGSVGHPRENPAFYHEEDLWIQNAVQGVSIITLMEIRSDFAPLEP